jgi:hypothetical protein
MIRAVSTQGEHQLGWNVIMCYSRFAMIRKHVQSESLQSRLPHETQCLGMSSQFSVIRSPTSLTGLIANDLIATSIRAS